MSHLMRLLAAATILLAPLFLGSGCVTLGTQWALGNIGCPKPPELSPAADRAWLVESADGRRSIWLEIREGEARRLSIFRLEGFEKVGHVEAAATVESQGATVPPGARALPILAEPWMEDGAQVGESGQDAPGAAPQPDEGIDPWGRVHLGPARCALALPWREEPVTAASVVGVAIAPITIAVDVGLLPVYALVGAGAGVYRVGELVADSVGE